MISPTPASPPMTRARKLRSGITDEEREGTEVINDVLQGVAMDASSDDDEDSVALESQQQASSYGTLQKAWADRHVGRRTQRHPMGPPILVLNESFGYAYTSRVAAYRHLGIWVSSTMLSQGRVAGACT